MSIEELKKVDVTTVNPDELVDIREIKINNRLKYPNQVHDFVEKIKNPYCYKYADYIVKIGFEDTAVTLTERLTELILKTANAG